MAGLDRVAEAIAALDVCLTDDGTPDRRARARHMARSQRRILEPDDGSVPLQEDRYHLSDGGYSRVLWIEPYDPSGRLFLASESLDLPKRRWAGCAGEREAAVRSHAAWALW